MTQQYKNRQQAGQILAQHLQSYKKDNNAIVLALPRGGVPVAYEVAIALSLPLDVYIIRKLGVPLHEEYAMGAMAEDNSIIWNEEALQSLSIQPTDIEWVIEKEKQELTRRIKQYRAHPLPSLQDKTIILIDDGLATGLSMKAAILAIQKQSPRKIIVATPVAAKQTCDEISSLVNALVCPLQVVYFRAVGLWYEDFAQTSDQEVIELLADAKIIENNS